MALYLGRRALFEFGRNLGAGGILATGGLLSLSELEYSTVLSPNDHMWNSGPDWYFDVGLSAIAPASSNLKTSFIDVRSKGRRSATGEIGITL